MRYALLFILAAFAVAPALAQSVDRDLIVAPPTGQGTLDPYDLIRAENPDQEFAVTLSTDDGRTRAFDGETVRFAVRSDRAGYVTLLNRNPEGTVTFLYPNAFSPARRIEAGETVYFPASEYDFQIRVSAPFGREYVKAIVTPELLVNEAVARREYDDGRALIVVAGRPDTDGGSDLGGFDPSQWATAALTLETAAGRIAARPPVALPEAPAARYSSDPIAAWVEAFTARLDTSPDPEIASASRASTSDPADEIVILYRPDAGSRAFGEAVAGGGQFGTVRVVPAAPSAMNAAGTRSLGEYGQTVEAQLEGLNNDPDVLVAFPNVRLYPTVLPSDPDARAWLEAARTSGPPAAGADSPRYWDLQWALHNGFDRNRYDVGWLDALAAYQTDDDPIVIAVLDSGVHLNHPVLRRALWTNGLEIAGNGRDDDGNGYVDDVHGWDAFDMDGDPTDPRPTGSHGTFVASQLAYEPGAPDVYGLAPNVQVMPVRVLGQGGGGADVIFAGIEYAIENGADIINLSLGTDARDIPQPQLAAAFEEYFALAERNNVLVVIAAGNDTADSRTMYTYPANVKASNALSVAALDIDGSRASFSNYGPLVDIAAPGNRILGYAAPDRRIEVMGGTSMAAPYVSAAAAVVWSQNRRMSPGQVRDRLLRSVRPVPDVDVSSGGTLDLARALSE